MNSIILVIEDDIIACEGIQAILEGEPYQIETATDGSKGIEKALEISPDLILLDVMMPGIDGFEVCRRIRSLPGIAEVPIIFLTALDDQNSIIRGLEAGADDFVTKPYNRHELRARVKTITRLNRYRRLVTDRVRIRELANRLITAQEEESKRIGQDLHDAMGQSLTSLTIGLKLLLDDLPAGQKEQQNRVLDLINLTKDIFNQVHSISSDLRPPSLDTVGLGPTLAGFCRDFSRRAELPIYYSSQGGEQVLPDAYNITLYRFLQEALSNVAKHADASQVWVKLIEDPEGTRLSVQDDGKGFSRVINGVVTAPIDRENGTTGLGLLGMRERLAVLDGRLEIVSHPDRGSRVTCWLPVIKTEGGTDPR